MLSKINDNRQTTLVLLVVEVVAAVVVELVVALVVELVVAVVVVVTTGA